MRLLVLGASGMAGHLISIYLQESGHEVIGYCRREVHYVKSIMGDAHNTEKIREVLSTGHFDAVINAIGVLNQNAETDKEAAAFCNGYLPHFLAMVTERTDTQVIQMSTDCVFSGKRGSYVEESLRDGETFYDRSKALGELEDEKNLTLRNSVVGPDINENGTGLLNWFMKQEGYVHGYTKVMWTGLTSLELARVIEKAVQEKASGLINMVPDTFISKYELLTLFNKYLKGDGIKIVPSDKVVLDKTLVRTNNSFHYRVPNYEMMVSDLAHWIRDHKYLYPHYNLA